MTQVLNTNYDTTQVGVPYIRVPRIEIGYPPPGSDSSADVTLRQTWAVKLKDGTILEAPSVALDHPVINTPVDPTDATPVPLVDPDTGGELDAGLRAQIAGAISAGVVTLPIAMLVILAVARSIQKKTNPAPGA